MTRGKMSVNVLFVCNQNSIRSPMAEILLREIAKEHGATGSILAESAGVYEGAFDPFLPTVLEEIDAKQPETPPRDLSNVDLSGFDVLVALTLEAETALKDAGPEDRVEFWETENPSLTRGSREQILEGYRRVRTQLGDQIKKRFGDVLAKA
ncbi:MAG: low molecular weight phosphatase family protein [Pseudomonadota bacterium]